MKNLKSEILEDFVKRFDYPFSIEDYKSGTIGKMLKSFLSESLDKIERAAYDQGHQDGASDQRMAIIKIAEGMMTLEKSIEYLKRCDESLLTPEGIQLLQEQSQEVGYNQVIADLIKKISEI